MSSDRGDRQRRGGEQRRGQQGGRQQGGDQPDRQQGGPGPRDGPQGGQPSQQVPPGGGRPPRKPQQAGGGSDDRRTVLALLGIAVAGVLGYGLLGGNGGDQQVTPGGHVVEQVQAAVSTSVDGSAVTTTFTSNGNAEHLEVEVDCGDDGTVDGTGTLDAVGDSYTHDCGGADVARVTVLGVGEDRTDVVHDDTVQLA